MILNLADLKLVKKIDLLLLSHNYLRKKKQTNKCIKYYPDVYDALYEIVGFIAPGQGFRP